MGKEGQLKSPETEMPRNGSNCPCSEYQLQILRRPIWKPAIGSVMAFSEHLRGMELTRLSGHKRGVSVRDIRLQFLFQS